MTDEWMFPSTFKFEESNFVSTNETWVGKPLFRVMIVDRGQRTTKNKKGESIFDCNSYQVTDNEYKLHYFLESELK
jgi:hypothetical protein